MAKSEIEIIKQIEAEFENIKPKVLSSKRSAFLNKGRSGSGGSGCGGIITRGSDGASGGGQSSVNYYPDLNSFAGSGTVIFDLSPIYTTYNIFQSWDIARYGDKIWMYAKYDDGVQKTGIIELDFNESIPSASFNRMIPLQNQSLVDLNSSISWLGGGTGVDSTTVVFSRRLPGIPDINDIIKFDVSGSTAIETILFPTLSLVGDMLYLPSSDSYMTIEYSLQAVNHYDTTGGLLGQVIAYPNTMSAGIFCYDGEIIVPYMLELYAVDFTTMSLNLLPQVGNWNLSNDAATNPECCDEAISTGCYDIGDIGPEGGIIFSVPGVGANTSTNMYYEVMQSDVAIAGTPNIGFNQSCFDDILVTVDTSLWISSGIGNNAVLFGWGPGSLNPNFDPSILNQGNIVSGLDSNGNSVFPPGSIPTILSITTYPPPNPQGNYNTVWIVFDTVMAPYSAQSQPAISITFTTTGSWSITGSEWGAYEILPTAIQTLTDFGTGLDNTDNIDTFNQCPPPFACHPVIDTHNVAATMILQDYPLWFLPSAIEFKEMVTQVGSLGTSQITLNSFGQNSEHLYWTSSQYKHNPLAPIQDPDKYSWAWDADTNTFKLAYRCHALSVRPIRRFECEPVVPCTGANCVEYNYRDGLAGYLHGSAAFGGIEPPFSGGPGSVPSQYAPIVNWYNTPEFTSSYNAINPTPPQTFTTNWNINPNYWGEDVIGLDTLGIQLNGLDVQGNRYSSTEFSNATGGEFFVTMWDPYYNYIGKWRYEFDSIEINPTWGGTGAKTGWEPDPTNPAAPSELIQLKLKNGVHVDGPYPVISSTGQGWLGIFIKLDWSGAVSFENGSNANIFGGQQPWLIGSHGPNNGGTTIGGFFNNSGFVVGNGNFPAYCGKGHSLANYMQNDPWITSTNNIWARYATFPPIDESGNVSTVHPDPYTAGLTTGVTNTNFLPWFAYNPAGGSNWVPVGMLNLCRSTPITNHCWSICAVSVGGSWYAVPDPWWNGQPYGPMAMENNPLGITTPPFSTNPFGPVNQDYTAFYDWMLTQVPTLTIGDSFIFQQLGFGMQFQFIDANGNISTSSVVQAICFKYRGVHNYVQPLNIANDNFPLPNIVFSSGYSCCVSGGSSSSLTRPTENNPDSIKINVDKTFNPSVFRGLNSKRMEFLSEAGRLDDFMVQNNIGPLLVLPTEKLPSTQLDDAFDPTSTVQLVQPEQKQQETTQFKEQVVVQPKEQVVIQPEQQRIIPPDEPEEEIPSPPRRDTGY